MINHSAANAELGFNDKASAAQPTVSDFHILGWRGRPFPHRDTLLQAHVHYPHYEDQVEPCPTYRRRVVQAHLERKRLGLHGPTKTL